MKAKRTTKKQFEEFKAAFLYWAERFGLVEWRFDFCLGAGDDGNLASCCYNWSGKNAHIELAPVLGGPDIIETPPMSDLALHECLHIVTASLRTCAESRYITPPEIDEADEVLVRKIVKVIVESQCSNG